MTQNIVIEFTSDVSGIQPGIDVLQELGKTDKDFAAIYEKTNALIAKQQKTIESSSSAVKVFSDSIQKADKAATGAFGTKALQSFTKQGVDGAKAIAKMIDGVETSLRLLQQAAKNALNPEIAKSYNQAIAESKAQLGELYAALDQLAEKGHFPDPLPPEVPEKVQTFKARLRELKNELQQMDDAGQGGTQRFRELSIEAAKLEDQIGDTNQQISILASDTFKSDVLVQGLQGVTAAFGLGQSAIALFGEENEDLQKTLVKLNAVMQISAGIEQLNNLVKGESAAKEAVKIALQKISILNTKLETAATSESIVVRNGATAAQWLLNAAMNANPGVLLLTVIGAIAGAFLVFSSNAETAAEAQAKLNEEWRIGEEFLQAYETELNKPNEDYIKKLKNELTLLQNQRVSESTLLAKKKEIANQEEILAARRAGLKRDDIEGIEQIQHEISNLKGKLKELNNEKNQSDDNWFYDRWFGGERSKKQIEEDIKAIEEKLKKPEAKLADAQKRQDELQEKSTARRSLTLEEQKKQTENFYKSEVGFAQAAASAFIEGTKARLNAELALNEKLKQQRLQDPNLSDVPGERAAIIAESAAKERAIKNNIRKLELEDEKSIIDAKIAAAEKGSNEELLLTKQKIAAQLAIDLNALGLSDAKRKELRAKELADQKEVDKQIELLKLSNQESLNNAALSKVEAGTKAEYNLRLNAANIERQRALIGAGENAAKKLEIEAAYWKKVDEMNKEYNYKLVQDALNIRIAKLNSKIAPLEIQADAATNQELLKGKKDLLDAQLLLEVAAINKKYEGNKEAEKLREAEVWAATTRTAAAQMKLDRDTLKAILEEKKATSDKEIEIELQKQEAIINSNNSTELEKVNASNKAYELKKNLFKNEKEILKQFRENNIISEAQYNQALLDLKKKTNAEDIKQTEETEKRKKEIRAAIGQTIIGIAQQISDMAFEIDAANRQRALDDTLNKLNESKNHELNAKNLTEQQKKDIEAKYAIKEKQLRRKAAEEDKKAKAAQAIINGILAVTNALATVPFPFNIIAAATVAASTAIQVAKIQSTPLPGLYRGTKSAKEGIYRLGELGKEMMVTKEGKLQMFGERREEIGYVPKGARVFNAKETSDLLSFLQVPNITLPDTPPIPMWANMQTSVPNITSIPEWAYAGMSGIHQSIDFDYDKLGKSVAKHVGKLSEIPGTNISIDENGISIIAQKGNHKVKTLNKRYSTK